MRAWHGHEGTFPASLRAFQMAEVATPQRMFQEILRLIAELRGSQLQRETLDGHVFKSGRRQECVQMPAKIVRSAPRPSFVLSKVTVAVQT